MLSEFRQNIVSGEWVLFSTNRTHSLRTFRDERKVQVDCPFDDFRASNNDVVFHYPDDTSREVTVIKNKYPAVSNGVCGLTHGATPFLTHDAVGEHDVFVFRDHDKRFAEMSVTDTRSIIGAYLRRYRELAKEPGCSKYITIFHNSGPDAGASVAHPHSQLISLPILPPLVHRSLHGAHSYYQRHSKKVFGAMLDWEEKEDKRMVYENDAFAVFCPFASRFPYEIMILPKNLVAHFEIIDEGEQAFLADALAEAIGRLDLALNQPQFNFFINTAPLESTLENIHDFYTWHIELYPRTTVVAGFEIETGMNINVVDPDETAKILREVRIGS